MKITKTFTDDTQEISYVDKNTFNTVCYAPEGKTMKLVQIEHYVEGKKIQKFRKKPVVIEAVQWNGNNVSELFDFVGKGLLVGKDFIGIETLEGHMKISVNDWIIRGVKGEFYPCKPEIFDETYEELTE